MIAWRNVVAAAALAAGIGSGAAVAGSQGAALQDGRPHPGGAEPDVTLVQAQPSQPGSPGQGAGPGMAGPGMTRSGPMGPDRMMPMMRGGMGPTMGMPMGPGMGPEMMYRHIEGRIAFLRAELGITEAQTPQWNAFAEALRANARAMSDMHKRMTQSDPPAALPQRLDQHEQMMASHLEALRRLKAAAGPLYAALDERQKRVADDLIMGMGGMHM